MSDIQVKGATATSEEKVKTDTKTVDSVKDSKNDNGKDIDEKVSDANKADNDDLLSVSIDKPDDSITLLDPEPVKSVPDVTASKKEKGEMVENSEGKKEDVIEDDNDKEENRPPLPTRKSNAASANGDESNNKEKSPSVENPLLKQLKEAFPNIEEIYIKTVIIASQGNLDPAFNALLYLSDPATSGKDIELPSRSYSDKEYRQNSNRTIGDKQFEQDEMLARQLNDQYNKLSRPSRSHGHPNRRRRGELIEDEQEASQLRREDRERRLHHKLSRDERRELYGDPDEDTWSHFVEKDIPETAAAATTTLQDAATKVSTWFSGVKNSWLAEGETNDANRNRNNNNNDSQYNYDQEQIRQQEEALRYYEKQKQQKNKDLPNLPSEENQFNSFGVRIGEDSLENHGISLNDDQLSIDDDDEDDVPPQLPKRERERKQIQLEDDHDKKIELESNDEEDIEDANLSTMTRESKVIPQTTYIDTPESKSDKKKWEMPMSSEATTTPTKVNATSSKKNDNKNAEDDFLINSDEDL